MGSPYIYLESQTIWASIFLVLLIICRQSRRLIFRSALAAIPLALTQGVYKGVWEPLRIGSLPVGIEDFLFCFLMGGISIALVKCLINNKDYSNSKKINWTRFLIIAPAGLALLTGLYLAGIRSYLNNYISMAIMVILIFSIKRDMWKIFIIGSLSVSIIYTLALQPGFIIWPDLLDLWVKERLSGYTIGSAPIEEVIWSFLFGGTWPLIFFFILDHTDEKRKL